MQEVQGQNLSQLLVENDLLSLRLKEEKEMKGKGPVLVTFTAFVPS